MNPFAVNDDYTIDLSTESDDKCLCPHCKGESFKSSAEIELEVFVNTCSDCNQDSINYNNRQYKMI